MGNYVDVILPIPLHRPFTYSIDTEEQAVIQQGMRVAVPFGKSKIYTGLVVGIHDRPPQAYEAKPIHQILDERPAVLPSQLQHWHWISEYYMCTIGEVFRTAVPGALLLESETRIVLSEEELDDSGLSDREFTVVESLHHRKELKVDEVREILELKNVLPVLNSLVSKRIILRKEELQQRYKPKLVRYIRLHADYRSEQALGELLDGMKRAPKQSKLVLALYQLEATEKQGVKLKALQEASGVSAAVIKTLLDKEVLEEYREREDRINFEARGQSAPPIVLNEEQEQALRDVRQSFAADKVALLFGVTASGKTEIYVKLIEAALDAGKQVLYLLPEIALTAQLIKRLQAYFGEYISVFHSRYNMQERVEVWQNVNTAASKARLIIGARSALFLPFTNLGLIIVDEEHDSSYKQYDPAPRYHARDAAIVLSKIHQSKIVLGSATPSLESYHNLKAGKYGAAWLTRRYGNVLMPEIELVDLKTAMRKRRMKGHFSEQLIELIRETLDAEEQVILFQNRRGFAPIVECKSCGHSPQCPNCDVSLTYHRFRDQLRCHYCGHSQAVEKSCPACGNPSLDTKGFGTQQVEDEVKALFPEAAVGRMDFDTTRGKYAHTRIIEAFEKREISILVGTQMLTKGLDFRNVNLVGIMNADTLLNFPDFRAHERSFQMLTQVAGRAGRTRKRGKVIVQSYNPYHSILQQVTTGDYEAMYKDQLYEREQYKYPPLNRLIRIGLKHRDYQKVDEAAQWFAQGLRSRFGEQVLGPEFPPVPRIRNQYIKHILLKIPAGQSLHKTKNSIKRLEQSFNAIPRYKGVRLVFDVDYM